MKLIPYQNKRKFDKIPKPKGRVRAGKSAHVFVVQKCDASDLHYGFRLVDKHVLKSWILPKGPSLERTVERIAVQIEHHLLE